MTIASGAAVAPIFAATSLSLSADLSEPYVVAAVVLGALATIALAIELYRGGRARKSAAVAVSGALAIAALSAAVLRPVSIVTKGSLVGPRVVVLTDASRSMDLPDGAGGTRRQAVAKALAELDAHASEMRLAKLAFGEGPPIPLGPSGVVPPSMHSDAIAALEAVARAPDERPSAIVLITDGRLDRPSANGAAESVRAALGNLSVAVHTVSVAKTPPPDASVRDVKAAGAAVAHQPLSLRVEIGCDGGLACDELPVTVKELAERGTPVVLASGTAKIVSGKAVIELSITLDRAGTRILEIATKAPSGDAVPDNDRRFVMIDVARERVRVLHVAGRPTYDVRALRTWLKSDASVDVVAFFILRTPTDDVNATQDELALIPFPVDELFTEHLPSFDAVVLQDFNAEPYGLTKHLPSLARYVERGGGLVMVGGPDAFVPGHYAGTAIAGVMPVELGKPRRGSSGVDLAAFVPRLTAAGRVAPVLGPLRALLGDALPEMPGTDLVENARPGSTVLLEHPTLTTPSGAPMPVLSLGESGNGRTIALTIDGSHRLSFSGFAAAAAGRAHGAFWDALLGWLMRDPRFEPAVVELPHGCIAGEEATLALRPLPGTKGPAKITVSRLGSGEAVRTVTVELGADAAGIDVPVGRLDPGGYSVAVELGSGAERAPTTRRDFACERGGDEWADSRPDPARLRSIADATGGVFVEAADAGRLPLPPATQVATERHVAPILPPWAWTLSAAMALGAHWIVRRKSGLS